jgi:phosphoglucosamine mutase
MAKLFGTDGMRGEAGRFPLDAATVRKVGASLAAHLGGNLAGRGPLIITGRDTRESGVWLERALIAGATEAGASCRSVGVITTPGVAFLARALSADAGVAISASHNPYQDNGVKIFSPSGKKLADATERLIEADIFAAVGEQDRNEAIPPSVGIEDGEAVRLQELYLAFLADEIARDLSLSGLTIVIDCANGAASHLAPGLFEQLGARVIAINNEPDGRNINHDCGSMHIGGLQRQVLEEHADLGVAFDGDADRALFVDEKGRFADGDATLWVLANYLNARSELSQGIVVATVMSNIGLEIALRARAVQLVRADVGDKYVLEELLRTGATLGGEQSGHLIFPRLSLAGDGMITTLSLLRVMREEVKSLSALTAGLKRYPQILLNVRVREKKPFEEIEPVQAVVQDVAGKLGKRGRLLLRYSGTEQLARVMIEGESQSEIEAHANRLASAIIAEIGAPEESEQ